MEHFQIQVINYSIDVLVKSKKVTLEEWDLIVLLPFNEITKVSNLLISKTHFILVIIFISQFHR